MDGIHGTCCRWWKGPGTVSAARGLVLLESPQCTSNFFLFFLRLAVSGRGERRVDTAGAGSRCVLKRSPLLRPSSRICGTSPKTSSHILFCADDRLHFFHFAVFLTSGHLPLTPLLFGFLLHSSMESTLHCRSSAVAALAPRVATYLHLNSLLLTETLASFPCAAPLVADLIAL